MTPRQPESLAVRALRNVATAVGIVAIEFAAGLVVVLAVLGTTVLLIHAWRWLAWPWLVCVPTS